MDMGKYKTTFPPKNKHTQREHSCGIEPNFYSIQPTPQKQFTDYKFIPKQEFHIN